MEELDSSFSLWKWLNSCVKILKSDESMSKLAVNGIAGFILIGISILIGYFLFTSLDYLLPIGSILIIIGVVTILQLKIANKL